MSFFKVLQMIYCKAHLFKSDIFMIFAQHTTMFFAKSSLHQLQNALSYAGQRAQKVSNYIDLSTKNKKKINTEAKLSFVVYHLQNFKKMNIYVHIKIKGTFSSYSGY